MGGVIGIGIMIGIQEPLESLVRREMEHAYALKVPLRVDIFRGSSWYKD